MRNAALEAEPLLELPVHREQRLAFLRIVRQTPRDEESALMRDISKANSLFRRDTGAVR